MAIKRGLVILLWSILFIEFNSHALTNEEIKKALAAVTPQNPTIDKEQLIIDSIKKLMFDEGSMLIITEIVTKFKDWHAFPKNISDAIVDVVARWAGELLKKTLNTNEEKLDYNKQVNALRTFCESINKIKQIIKIVSLPKEAEIEPAWKTERKLQLIVKALTHIKELTDITKVDLGHINTLNLSCGQKGALKTYVNSEVCKKDEDFIDILKKIKNILDTIVNASTTYNQLWDVVFEVTKPVLPPRPLPKPPVEDNPLKDKLVILKTDLFQLSGKLQLLLTKMVSLKKGLEAAMPLGSAEIKKITDEWRSLLDSYNATMKDKKGAQVIQSARAAWKNNNLKNKDFVVNLSELVEQAKIVLSEGDTTTLGRIKTLLTED